MNFMIDVRLGCWELTRQQTSFGSDFLTLGLLTLIQTV